MVGTALQYAVCNHRRQAYHYWSVAEHSGHQDHEEELIRARRLAEHAELKQSFLNNMSHEIRTPLNAIAGFANLLVYDPELSGAEKQEYAGIINTNTKLLLKLVDDVLQLSRMETANMSFDLRRESVHHLLETIYQTHSVLINPPLEFVTDFSDRDVFVNVDCIRLTQVITNFLNNANKFTPQGYIKLGYIYGPATNEVSIYVEDTGIGIPKEEQEMIFARFYKRSEFSQGVGLGLAICKAIAEKLGGRIEVESQVGREAGLRWYCHVWNSFYVICCIWIAVDSILKKCSMIVMYLYIILLIFANVFENITF